MAAVEAMDLYTDLDRQMIESALFPECVLETSRKNVDFTLFLDDYQSGFNSFQSSKAAWKPEQVKPQNDEISLGLDWMDEKMDLSILDCPESWSGLLDDPLAMAGDPTTLLDSLTDFDSTFINNDTNNQPKTSEDTFTSELKLEPFDNLLESSLPSEPTSPVGIVPDSIFASGINSPQSSQSILSEPRSPNIVLDDINTENYLSTGSINVMVYISDANNKVSEPITSPSSPELMLSDSNSISTTTSDVSLSEEFTCMVTKQYDPVKPFSLPLQESLISQKSELCKPKAKSASSSARRVSLKEGRRERKKVQNKEAAARYRVKKRNEGKALHDEVSIMEDQNKKLTEKVQQLSSEIKYLKGLMREMFKARGLLK